MEGACNACGEVKPPAGFYGITIEDYERMLAALRYLHVHDPDVHEARALTRARVEALVTAHR